MIEKSWIEELLDAIEAKKRNEIGTVGGEPLSAILDDEDFQFDQMLERQRLYESQIAGYQSDHPSQMFKHSFIRSGYLPCKIIKCEPLNMDRLSAAEDISENAYYENSRGIPTLNQVEFCNIWYSHFRYVYCGYILTPNGKIEPDVFKSEIIQMLSLVKKDTKNIDSLSDHIFKTYVGMYRKDGYDVTNLIPFKNGDLVLNDDNKGFTFYEGRKNSVPYRFSYEFHNIPNESIEPTFPNFKKWRDELFDEEDYYSLKQLLGYLLLPTNEAQEAFFIIGKAGSGKSILTDCVIPAMLGDACFPISIGQFFDDKFQLGTSEGMLCMVDDDIGEALLSNEDSGRFKNFVTAETIKIEHKYCNPTKIVNGARIVCSGNHMIRSEDRTDGFTRRLHPIYVKPRSSDEVDRKLPKKIASEIEMIVLWALEGLLEVKAHDGIPYRSYRTDANIAYYSETQKWEEQFIEDCFVYGEDVVTYSNEVRDVLADWIKENAEISGEGTLSKKFNDVSKWLKDEGADKFGFEYKRGIKRGDKYNARGYVHMARKKPSNDIVLYTDERGKTMLRISKKGMQEIRAEQARRSE